MIGSEKTTLMAQKKCIFLRRAKVTSVLSILQLFQAHSTFHCVVMGANAKRGSRTPNEIIASKRVLPVKNIKHPYSYVAPCYYITLSQCTCMFILERGFPVSQCTCMFILERGFPVYVTP